MRLIDADVDFSDYVDVWTCHHCGDVGNVEVMAVEAFDDIPTIDPETLPIVQELQEKLAKCEPVIHAHWEPFSKTENRGYKCSHCKKGRISNSDYCSVNHRNYCYCCGAKMDEEG